MTLGNKLQILRKQKGLSQEQLANRLGVSRQAVSKWELDATLPDTENIIKLKNIFDVSFDYLIDDTQTEYKSEPLPVQEHSQIKGNKYSNTLYTILIIFAVLAFIYTCRSLIRFAPMLNSFFAGGMKIDNLPTAFKWGMQVYPAIIFTGIGAAVVLLYIAKTIKKGKNKENTYTDNHAQQSQNGNHYNAVKYGLLLVGSMAVLISCLKYTFLFMPSWIEFIKAGMNPYMAGWTIRYFTPALFVAYCIAAMLFHMAKTVKNMGK